MRLSGVAITLGVSIVHLALFTAFDFVARQPPENIAESSGLNLELMPATASTRTVTGQVPVPLMHLKSVEVTETSLTEIIFADPDADIVPGVIGMTSAPRPLPLSPTEAQRYAVRAGLVAGESVTVVLKVEVLTDGSVGQIGLQSASGNPAVDLEAIAMARTVRWIPATLRRRAITAIVPYVVTLTATT